jgi:hypothetical protein
MRINSAHDPLIFIDYEWSFIKHKYFMENKLCHAFLFSLEINLLLGMYKIDTVVTFV